MSFRLRLTPLDGPELCCPHCGEWWAITLEHWDRDEFHMCRACKREKARLYQRLRMRDAQYRVDQAGRSRRYRAWLKATCPEYVRAYDRERKARDRARALEYRKGLRGRAI